jgi:8-oxo-dGTP pyrophosphatase MutT (NUDIX family)
MNEKNKKLFHILATAIILKDPYRKNISPKYLIVQRANHEKTFPGKWTVPGGKMETTDYSQSPKETEHYWYSVLEKALRREVEEEVGIKIKNIWYVTSLARILDEGYGSVVLSFAADYSGGEIILDEDMQDYAWVTYEEAKEYDLIDGILDEIYMAERKLAGEMDVTWKRA